MIALNLVTKSTLKYSSVGFYCREEVVYKKEREKGSFVLWICLHLFVRLLLQTRMSLNSQAAVLINRLHCDLFDECE